MSSTDAFSFDNAVPVEAMESSLNESNESSAIQSSHDGTYSQVTSAHRSDSSKRLRRIEDADPNSRSSGAPGSPRSRVARSSSSQRSDKRRTVKKSDKSRGSGGSPGGRSRPSNADEELERMIADMRGQSDQLRDQILRLEDEKRQDLMLYDSKNAECQERVPRIQPTI